MTVASIEMQTASFPETWRRNWRVYLIDGALLGLFMMSACLFVMLVEYRSSPVRQWIEAPMIRRALVGLAMGLTAIALIYSPWGRRSGALMNPAMTLGFVRLGRLNAWDAAGYIAAQFAGAAAGVGIMALMFAMWVKDSSVNYVATRPGAFAIGIVWGAEFSMALLMMAMVMGVNQVPALRPYTGCFAGLLVALYITFEAPISGMSLNPARTFGSAIHAQVWTAWWVYFTAPVAGMLAGIELHRAIGSKEKHLCGKLTHSQNVRCHIGCDCLKHTSEEKP